jgi:hypothetical protein
VKSLSFPPHVVEADKHLYDAVRAAALQVNTTHKGRILRGTLVEKPSLVTSVQVLLQDEAGDIVKVISLTRHTLHDRLMVEPTPYRSTANSNKHSTEYVFSTSSNIRPFVDERTSKTFVHP